MRLEESRDAKKRAKRLRRELTPPERALWRALRRNEADLRFRKQHGAGEYVLDFYCAPAKLCIEVDGEAHERGDRPERDEIRTRWLADQGVRTIRFAARDVLTSVEGVLIQVVALATRRIEMTEARRRPPPPSAALTPPRSGGGC